MTDTKRVLVAYGSKHGATAEIAAAIADTLRAAGLEADLMHAGDVDSLDPYRAVVLGSAVYIGRWRRDALHLLRRPGLRDREVWLFSSGPVGEETDDPKSEKFTRPQKVEDLAAELGAHEHAVFGGKAPEDGGFVSRKMSKNIPPELRDRRDWEEIEAWARSIAATLSAADSTSPKEPAPATRRGD